METYIVHLPSGEVLGAVESETPEEAGEAVANELPVGDTDAVAVEVNVARVTDADYEVPEEISPMDDGIEVVERNLAVALHG